MADLPDTIELRIRLSEAETATKFADFMSEMRGYFARLDSRMDRLDGRMDHLDGRIDRLERSTANIRPAMIGTALAAVAIVIAVMAYGQTWFGIGVTTRDIVKSAVSEYIQQHPAAQP